MWISIAMLVCWRVSHLIWLIKSDSNPQGFGEIATGRFPQPLKTLDFSAKLTIQMVDNLS